MFSAMTEQGNEWKTERRPWWIAASVVYLLLLVFLLIIPNNYRSHNVFVGGLTPQLWAEYVARGFSIIPFSSLSQQFGSIAAGDDALRHIVYLVGNIIGFIPLGFLLPILFKRQRRFGTFALSVLLGFIALEITQLMTMRGLFDIDDIILYALGAMIGFLLFRKWNQYQSNRIAGSAA
jgi:glycopeptide antibiotics resistance protein